MAEESALERLSRRLDEIAAGFLPTESEMIGDSSLSKDRLRAFLLLSHAEIEDHIEQLLANLVTSELGKWNSNRQSGRVLTSVVAYHPLPWPPAVKKLDAPSKEAKREAVWINRDVDCRIKNAVRQYQRKVEENNGIKQDDLLALLLPVGALLTELDPLFLSECEELGSVRGRHAHTATSRVESLPNPSDVKARVNRVLAGVRELESYLSKLAQPSVPTPAATSSGVATDGPSVESQSAVEPEADEGESQASGK